MYLRFQVIVVSVQDTLNGRAGGDEEMVAQCTFLCVCDARAYSPALVCDYVPSAGSYDGEEKEAMEEARLAIVEIVIPRRQPIELLPRVPWILKMQVQTQALTV